METATVATRHPVTAYAKGDRRPNSAPSGHRPALPDRSYRAGISADIVAYSGDAALVPSERPDPAARATIAYQLVKQYMCSEAPNFVVARTQLRRIGSPEALCELGDMCRKGLGGPKSDRAAAHYYRLSQTPKARRKLAELYETIDIRPECRTEAMKLLFARRTSGSFTRLGKLMLESENNELFYQAAYEAFKDAETPEAHAHVAFLFATGRGIKTDLDEAARRLMLCRESLDTNAGRAAVAIIALRRIEDESDLHLKIVRLSDLDNQKRLLLDQIKNPGIRSYIRYPLLVHTLKAMCDGGSSITTAEYLEFHEAVIALERAPRRSNEARTLLRAIRQNVDSQPRTPPETIAQASSCRTYSDVVNNYAFD